MPLRRYLPLPWRCHDDLEKLLPPVTAAEAAVTLLVLIIGIVVLILLLLRHRNLLSSTSGISFLLSVTAIAAAVATLHRPSSNACLLCPFIWRLFYIFLILSLSLALSLILSFFAKPRDSGIGPLTQTHAR
ncbi:unnamed protein product, partial [Schistocephalus solidus]|uniref:Uncharacterized protein n=1 Tax=Schistocephalus solidus TaxID=70667 RepID=A0A183T883_SCHSO